MWFKILMLMAMTSIFDNILANLSHPSKLKCLENVSNIEADILKVGLNSLLT